MLVRIALFEVAAAEVAEVCVAFEADHVIASVRLLGSGIAGRAGLGVQLHVFLRSALFGRDLELGAREAGEVFAVPGGFADEAEGKGAVFADCESVRWGWKRL